MKDILIRRFLCKLNNLKFKKHFFLLLDFNRTSLFVIKFLNATGYLRGFYFFNKASLLKKIVVIPKYIHKDGSSFCVIKKRVQFFNRLQLSNKKNVKKSYNGLGIGLNISISGFISNEKSFFFKIGSKTIFELK